MRRVLLWTVPAGLAACGLALWLSSRMKTEPLPRLPPPAIVPCYLEARLGFREEPDLFVFRVSGTTHLPPETVLRARVHAVETVSDWRVGVREDEEPLVWDEDDGQPPFRAFRPNDGDFAVDVHVFRRRPYSLRYRARLTYRPEDQGPEVRRLLGEEEISVAADLRLGNDASLARELAERHGEMQADLFELEGIWRQLRSEVLRQRGTPDPEAWQAWSSIWAETLEASERRNAERFGLWCVMTERQAKMRIGGTAGLLRRMIDDQAAALAGDRERADRLQARMAALSEYLEEMRDVVGIDAIDPEVFAPLLGRYEKAVAGLPATRGEALSALLECAPPLRARRRVYALLNDVGYRLARLLERPDPQARAAHDLSLGAFKSLAGLD